MLKNMNSRIARIVVFIILLTGTAGSTSVMSVDLIYITNYDNSTISKFDNTGAFLSSMTSNLDHPTGIAIDSSGNLYAAN